MILLVLLLFGIALDDVLIYYSPVGRMPTVAGIVRVDYDRRRCVQDASKRGAEGGRERRGSTSVAEPGRRQADGADE